MSRYMLVYDYPGEEDQCVGCDTPEQIATELIGNVVDDQKAADAFTADLLREGVWHDEGGKIMLYQRIGTHGVNPSDKTQQENT